jgi:ubiquitin-protein ligase
MNNSGFTKSPEKLSPEKMSNKNYAQVWKGVSGLPNDLQFKINKMVINNYSLKMEDKVYYNDKNAEGMDGRYMCYLSNTKYPALNETLFPLLRSIRGQVDIMKKNRRKYNKKIKTEIKKIRKHTDYTDDGHTLSIPADTDTEKIDKFININNVYAELENQLTEKYDMILDKIKSVYLYPEIMLNIYELLNLLDKDTPLRISGGTLYKNNSQSNTSSIQLEIIADTIEEEAPKLISNIIHNPYQDYEKNKKDVKKYMDKIWPGVKINIQEE